MILETKPPELRICDPPKAALTYSLIFLIVIKIVLIAQELKKELIISIIIYAKQNQNAIHRYLLCKFRYVMRYISKCIKNCFFLYLIFFQDQ